MSDFANVVPDWSDVPEDDQAESDEITVEHEATPEEVAQAAEADEEGEA